MTRPGWIDERIAELAPDLALDARERLAGQAAEIAAEPSRVAVRFPAAARTVARGPADPADPGGLAGPTLDDQARAVLLAALRHGLAARGPHTGAADADPLVGGGPLPPLAAEVAALYRFGDADEKRAVLRALPVLDAGSAAEAADTADTVDPADAIGPAALPLVADALRTNDVRLVAAALGPYAARHLDADAWRQGVLKCLFVGVPLDAVAGLDRRADAELARMLAGYAVERAAAGRDVPADVWRVLDRHPAAVDASGLVELLRAPHPDQRAAAEQALASSHRPASVSRKEDLD
ncbi:EboA domain-containing protein [Allonocardiopsis opalescens]|uniref:HEAT repeat protein n=1 Tax=Allonocardiopsis opalescens TaxID=1144618 RepID=A0A2T0QCY1_9ACTN|nr:EboA domain-containing protein [Allonocardiopsis opalescens]PRY01731.1 hypothetical protein CLV72_101315 [Allonocardiopsis opalescens]